jgi:hypothetical protein
LREIPFVTSVMIPVGGNGAVLNHIPSAELVDADGLDVEGVTNDMAWAAFESVLPFRVGAKGVVGRLVNIEALAADAPRRKPKSGIERARARCPLR